MVYQSAPYYNISTPVKHSIRITTVFVTGVALKSWLNPLDINNMNNYGIIYLELLNVIGM